MVSSVTRVLVANVESLNASASGYVAATNQVNKYPTNANIFALKSNNDAEIRGADVKVDTSPAFIMDEKGTIHRKVVDPTNGEVSYTPKIKNEVS